MKILERIRVLLTAAPTYLTAAAVVVAAVAEEIGEAFPGVDGTVAGWAAPVLAGIAAIIAIVRRVSPVVAAERGLLPSAPGGE